MESKFKAQRLNIKKLKDLCESVTKAVEIERTGGFFEAKNRMISALWSKVDTTNDAIIEGVTSEDELTVGKEFIREFEAVKLEYDKILVVYDKVMVEIHTGIEKLNAKVVPQLQPLQLPNNLVLNANNKSSIKLKPIDIPTFSGDCGKWISFRNMFDSLVHNDKAISKLQKIHYLKSCLSDEAERIVRQFDITEDSYQPAYDALTNRFHNEVILIDTHIINILSQPDLKVESSNGLKELLDVTTENLRALESLKIDTTSWDPILLLLLVQKLDASTRRLWEQNLKPKVRPTIKEFMEFLGTRFHALGCQQKFRFSMESSSHSNESYNRKIQNNANRSYKPNGSYSQGAMFPPRVHQNFHNATGRSNGCPFRCSESHDVMKCELFRKADVRTRQDLVSRAKLCTNCLKPHGGKCASNPGCQTCNRYHHELLHPPNASVSSMNPPKSSTATMSTSVNQNSTVALRNHHTHVKPTVAESTQLVMASTTKNSEVVKWDEQILLSTAIVLVRSMKDNRLYPFRALLDDASEASYVSEFLAQSLGLVKKGVLASSTGLGGVTTSNIRYVADFEIGSKRNPAFSMMVQGPVTTKVTQALPSSFIKKGEWDHIKELPLADPQYHIPSKIDLLLGASVYGYLLLPGLVKTSAGEPVARNTEFGWILSGPVRSPSVTHNISTFHLKINLEDQLKKFFEQEEVSKERILTKEEHACERFFMDTYKRKEDGRFVVALPFKINPKALGSSKGQAVSRLTKLEERLDKNEELKEEYSSILKEYENLEHTTRLGPLFGNENSEQSYYLPHHAVFKPESTTTRTRVVFDASAKSTTNISLNDVLMTGPTLQEDLISILIRWRSYQFIFSADIAKMYRQVEIRQEDRKYQKFLFREGKHDKIQEYQHNMVTFGVTSATYLAVKSLQQLAVIEKENFPRASEIVRKDFYMDDGMSGADTEEMCAKLCGDVKKLLAKGKFELRKFISNSEKVLETIPEKDREIKLPMEINLDSTVKTLGIHYYPTSDQFRFKVNLKVTNKWPTKRSLLSETSRLFDPLGWLAPVVIRAKLMFQKLWQIDLTWEQKLPEDLAKEWITFRDEMHLLEDIRIDRWIGKGVLTRAFELHGFSDASERAFSAVVYTRVVNIDGSIRVTLITSKTRVAPTKTLTSPRLELNGLVLLANLMNVVQRALDVDNENSHAWTDSMVVLGWLRTSPTRLKTYVANRVVETQNFLDVNNCHHIEGTQNPADCASRGIKPSDLEKHELWWNGPDILKENRSSWDQHLEIPPAELELKTKVISTHVVISNGDFEEWINRYSSFEKLVRITAICVKFMHNSMKSKTTRVTALCLVFVNNVRAKLKKPQLIVTARDLRTAEKRIIKICQGKVFAREIHHLANGQSVNKKSNILSLNPVLDKNGCLRVGGRLEEANIPYDRKHPIILSAGRVADLIIADAHSKSLHGGTKLTMNLVRERFCILNLRRQVKNHILKCVQCCRYKKENSNQIMADLPWTRVNVSSPFTQVGLDYAGPYDLKASNVRSPPIRIKPTMVNGELVKSMPKVPVYEGYISLFVCLATKAVHIEVVSDKSTDAFLAAFDRFTARKGFPECCYSDNASTFIGAKSVLAPEPEFSLLDYDRISRHTIKDGTDWKFIPPRAPHYGGIWESGIKSMKHHLKRVIGENILTFEEMSTITAKIEACLNSRPLCALNDDPNDLAVLTPGHFLIGRPMIVRPESNSVSKTVGSRDRWRLIQKVQTDFWKSWSNEYLNELQNRQKWKIQTRNFEEGDMVLSKEDNFTPSKWPLARIVKIHPSKDENVRSATIRFVGENGKVTELVRPIVKLRLLPTKGEESEQSANINRSSKI